MLHALQANQASRELLNLPRFPVDDKDLKARIMVQVCMTGRDHKRMVGMLQFGQLLSNAVSMMVVDEGDSAYYGRARAGRPLGHQAIPNQITECFRPVGITQPGDEIVEALEEIRIECNPNSAENTHGHSR